MTYIIGSRIKRVRDKRGITQKELADKIGVKAAVISNWETGKNRPNVDLLPAICKALSVSADELLDIKVTDNEEISEETAEIMEKFKKAEEKKKKLVREILEL